jgi:hypothetical protein
MTASRVLLVVAAALALLAAIDVVRERGVSLRSRIRLIVAAVFGAAALLTP